MKGKLAAPVQLTAKQARFVACMASGMTGEAAYRMAYDTEADSDQVRVAASKLKAKPNVALALREALRSARLQDLVSPGEIVSRTLEHQQQAIEDHAHSAVVGYDRLLGNWAGIEKQTVEFKVEHLMSDQELIDRLAGEDPVKIEAARKLLGAPEGFETLEHEDTDQLEDAVGEAESALESTSEHAAGGAG